jgi:hypothetical protein
MIICPDDHSRSRAVISHKHFYQYMIEQHQYVAGRASYTANIKRDGTSKARQYAHLVLNTLELHTYRTMFAMLAQ